MTKTSQDVSDLYQGTTRKLEFACTDRVTGAARNVSTFTLEWYMFKDEGDPVSRAVVTKPDAQIAVFDKNDTNDGARVTLNPEDTARLPPGKYPHELRGTDAAGDEDVMAVGTITLLASPSGRD